MDVNEMKSKPQLLESRCYNNKKKTTLNENIRNRAFSIFRQQFRIAKLHLSETVSLKSMHLILVRLETADI